MAKLNAVKAIKEWEGRGFVNPRYDLTVGDVQEITKAYPHPFERFCAGFLFGYIQGHKAAAAEMKVSEKK